MLGDFVVAAVAGAGDERVVVVAGSWIAEFGRGIASIRTEG